MRVLFAIGCNLYEHATQLGGAERDAQRIYGALIRPEIGEYDVYRSRILLSPTFDEVRKAPKDVLFATPQPETFTLFFAGHGSVAAGAFYMWLKDSSPRALSMSALSLAEIFRSLIEAAPLQSNIIIDACESGGLIQDLSVLLKPDLLGNSGTPGLTLVASSAQDQHATETAEGGDGTVALLDCIEGRDFVQDHRGTLDLVEIGMRISQRLRRSGQNPVVWGLNLYGATGFCKNPRFGSDPASALRQSLHSWPRESNEIIRHNYDALWAAYSATGWVWEPKKYSSVVNAVLLPFLREPMVLVNLADRLAATFLQKAIEARDPFRGVEVATTLAVALLPSVQQLVVANTAQRLLDHACSTLIDAITALTRDLDSNKYALISDRRVLFSELHELPLRLTKVLGWASAATFLCRDDSQRKEAEVLFARVVSLVLEHYSGSIISFSDAQAPGWCVALSACARMGLREEGEQFSGMLFNSLVHCGGRLAASSVPRNRALEYLLARRGGDYSHCQELVARPIELLTSLFKAAELFGLESIFDESLWKIDGLAFSAYLPANYVNYGDSLMKGGRNLVWTIGHDIFKTKDFTASWPTNVSAPQSRLIASLALAASLLYNDRQAWFLFES
jgi:hypothetical protein